MYELTDDHDSSAFGLLDGLWAARLRRCGPAEGTPKPFADRSKTAPAASDSEMTEDSGKP